MPLEPQKQPASVTESGKTDFGSMIFGIARQIANLSPGPAAALRRGPLAGSGTAAFWKILADFDIGAKGKKLERWAALVQAIAILTPKGRIENKLSAHDGAVPMGMVLRQAEVTELRLARMLSARGENRCDHAIRVCRRLAAAGPVRFDLRTLAQFMLFDDDGPAHWIARTYYRAMSSAHSKQQGDAS